MALAPTPLQRLVAVLPRRGILGPLGLIPEDMARALFPLTSLRASPRVIFLTQPWRPSGTPGLQPAS